MIAKSDRGMRRKKKKTSFYSRGVWKTAPRRNNYNMCKSDTCPSEAEVRHPLKGMKREFLDRVSSAVGFKAGIGAGELS